MALKVALMCDSPLLKRALERFLRGHIVPFGQCDLVISDNDREVSKPLLCIGQQLVKPFSRAHLQMALDRFAQAENISTHHQDLLSDRPASSGGLDQEVEQLARRFAHELLTLLQKGAR